MAAPGSFQLLAEDSVSRARRGRLMTAHGMVETPTFMPVGTYGAVKGMAPWEIEDLGAGILLSNAYHLAMRPGADHRFWPAHHSTRRRMLPVTQ